MTKINRLIKLLQTLRTQRPPVRAAFLAQEMRVSQRSIYRDIDSLRSMGAIIDGAAGFGYTLIEDPALPPMMFETDEIEALVLGLREVRSVADPVLAKAADNALSKIKATMPDRLRGQFDHASLYAKQFRQRPRISIDVAQLRNAIREELMIDISYVDGTGAKSERRALPLGIVFMDTGLMLMAWCNLRSGFRAFRLDRITTLRISDQSFRPRRVRLLRECFEDISKRR